MIKQANDNKKGIFKTIEMMITILLTFIFALVISDHLGVQETVDHDFRIKDVLQKNIGFRNCVLSNNQSCLDSTVRVYLNPLYDFSITISKNPDYVLTGLPDSQVYVESMFIAGNYTTIDSRIVKVYIYEKQNKLS